MYFKYILVYIYIYICMYFTRVPLQKSHLIVHLIYLFKNTNLFKKDIGGLYE